ncbi:MAG: ATP-binding cassette domain-containing protein, partial [Kofleriaceae bacterium]
MKKDPHPHLPGGTGTGPAGGAPVPQTTPSRDPAAEAAALAAFENEDERSAREDLPAPAPTAVAAPVAARPPQVTGGAKVEPPGKALVKPPVVAFDKVTKTYGTGPDAFTAIKDVSFAIEDYPGRGEFVSILGPSGCGKSTVIRMIAGLLPQFPQSSGTVLVDG